MTSTLTRIGDYAIEHEIATMGAVVRYEGRHVVLPRRAAIEVLLPLPTGSRPAAVQMMREACIVEALRHAGVPRIYECGVTPDRRPWVALELVEGETLDDELRRGPLAVAEVVALLEHVAEILAHAHARGVLHRDVTPSAIVRGDTERGFPLCVQGWGAARTLDTELPPPPRGLNHYRALELLRGDEIDGRADVFALGAIAYQALTGELPSLPITRRAPRTPAPVAALIEQMLSDDRYQRPTAIEVCDMTRIIRKQATATAGVTETVPEPVEEVVLLVDVSRGPIRARPRWTPQLPLDDRASAATRDAEQSSTRRRRSVRDDR
jgi:serine/threonine protein kinase